VVSARPRRCPRPPLLCALTSEALELLKLISERAPGNVQELATLCGRAPPNVSRSLQVLAKHGLLKLVRQGREVRPVPMAREVRVDLRTGTYVKC